MESIPLPHDMMFDEPWKTLTDWLDGREYSGIWLLDDEHTHRDCWPRLPESLRQRIQGVHTVPAGESSKSLQHCESIWRYLLEQGVDRTSVLLNLGGGVICDLGGFCGSTILRGIAFVHLPTSLLAMVDAAVGGKTGINFHGGKNLIGQFAHPELVCTRSEFLETLPERHLRAGMAEMAKHALLDCESSWDAFYRDQQLEDFPLVKWIRSSVEFKSNLTSRDFKESGLRQNLNLGHTVAHAIESQDSDGHWLHGEAVWAGLWCSAKLSEEKFESADSLLTTRLTDLCHRFIPGKRIPVEKLARLRWDKKRRNEEVRMVLLKEVGQPMWPVVVSGSEIEAVVRYYNRMVTR